MLSVPKPYIFKPIVSGICDFMMGTANSELYSIHCTVIIYGQKATTKVSAKSLMKKHLTPRRHLNALQYLVQIDAFDDAEEGNSLISLVLDRKKDKSCLTSSDSSESESETQE